MKVLVIDDCREVTAQILRALNAAELPEGCELHALNFEMPQDGSAPDEIELLQPGQSVVGRDGRSWVNDDPAGIVAALIARGVDLVVDFEHSTEIKAPKGEEAPAAGWVKVKSLQVRDGGAVWGKVEWTPRGLAAVANREYRYLSPVIIFEKATGRIKRMSSIGLVNQPNLFNKALNREDTKGAPPMFKRLLAKLGLPETATEDQAPNALGALETNLATALNRAETPSLDKFVPRADYDTVVAKATNAEQQLAEQKKAELETAINAEIDLALKAGKITPATKDYHVATCREAGGLDRFKSFVAAAPVVAAASDLDNKEHKDGKALNAEELAIAEMFGNSADDLKKHGA